VVSQVKNQYAQNNPEFMRYPKKLWLYVSLADLSEVIFFWVYWKTGTTSFISEVTSSIHLLNWRCALFHESRLICEPVSGEDKTSHLRQRYTRYRNLAPPQETAKLR